MNLERKISHLLMFGFNKDIPSPYAAGSIIFKRNVKYLRHFSRKVFIAVDQEGGRVTRIKTGVTPVPAPAEIKTVKQAYAYGKIMADELLPLGISLNLAPVVDVNTEKNNPIIGKRSFGSDAKRVARFSAAMIRGMQENGLLACAKHFPGHGAAKKDSHKCLPHVNISAGEWEKTHFPPFISAIKAGVACIMAGHILCPALDKKYPASLSRKIINGILREDLGFKGVIITDDICMGAIAKHYSPFPEEAAVLAINAGADIVLVGKGAFIQAKVRKALIDAVRKGRITQERIDESVSRVLELKKHYDK